MAMVMAAAVLMANKVPSTVITANTATVFCG